MRKLMAAAAALGLLTGAGAGVYRYTPDPGPYIVGTSPGGSILDFLDDYDALRRSGRQVRIDGLCISACTLITGEVPPDRICVTPFAKLAFHSATLGDDYSAEGTRIVWHIYPENVRALLRAHGWDGETDDPKAEKKHKGEHPELIYIEGKELLSLYRAC